MNTSRKTVLFYVMNDFADWEAAYALTGIRKSAQYRIKSISPDLEPKTSMGGLKVMPEADFLPDVDLHDIDDSNTAMLILPGGTSWVSENRPEVVKLVDHCVAHGIPVAAICGATILLARMGLLDGIEHTSNDLSFLQSVAPSYRGRHLYQHRESVNGGGLITAAGTAPVAFARDIFDALGIKDHPFVAGWFRYFDDKAVPLSSLIS